MYNIKQYVNEGLKVYELSDEDSKSYIKVVPERGAIITELVIDGKDILYLNKETLINREANIRGGIPILFPISGQLENGEYELNSRRYQMKNHGFARNLPWEVVETNKDKELSMKLCLRSNEETKKVYPFEFEVIYKYILKKNTLIIEQEYKNLSDEEMPFYSGFHPYFKTSQKALTIDSDAKAYLDYNDLEEKPFRGIIDLTDKKESLMLLDTKKTEIAFNLQEAGKRISLEYGDEFKYVVCWTEEGKEFVCVEPWMARSGELNRQEELVYLKPAESLTTFFQIMAE
ncbi:aldose epimerase [Bacillus sp. FJAT-49736]|uniref:aldose epimerase family protein n=1 Tax=Bacillus sp. FJAT-49736 TaxID=2833582 RepID=UPI001BC94A6C|nr:aldose epimerase [Bacillus sp. FJAT-49736]MBS4175008.1 aldose epimerase [Bacillus sp. FJAT-49736]